MNHFDPYKIIPDLQPYRYPLHALRQYNGAIRSKVMSLGREMGTLYRTTDLEDQNAIIHRYISHVSKPRKLFNYHKRITSELEYGTQPLVLRPSLRGPRKIDFTTDF